MSRRVCEAGYSTATGTSGEHVLSLVVVTLLTA